MYLGANYLGTMMKVIKWEKEVLYNFSSWKPHLAKELILDVKYFAYAV